MHRVAALLSVGCFALSAAASSQPLSLRLPENRSASLFKAGTECTGGIRYDDGHFESGLFFDSSNTVGRLVSLFQLPAAVSCLRRGWPDARRGQQRRKAGLEPIQRQ